MYNYTENQSEGVEKLDLIFSNCVVEFRPENNWKGEYGFDWLRRGDYEEIICGRKLKFDYKNIVKDYESFKSEYPKLKYYDLDEKKYKFYYSPSISLYYESTKENSKCLPNEMLYEKNGVKYLKEHCITEAIIKIRIYAKNVEKIKFEYDKKSFEVFDDTIENVPDGLSEGTIKIKYLFDGFKDNYKGIKAIAYFKKNSIVTNNSSEWISRACAGQVNVVRCIPKKIEVRFVIILSRFNKGIQKPSAVNVKKDKEILCKYLAQANVIPDIDIVVFPSDKQAELNRILERYKVSYTNCGYGIKTSDSLRTELDELYLGRNKYGNIQYGKRYYMYIINECADSGGHAPVPGHSAMVFKKSSDDCTICHELLHCLELNHSFSNKSKHVFAKEQTSNIMDYTNGYTLWKWQWQHINRCGQPILM